MGRSAKWVQRARRANPAFPARVKELKAQRAAAAAAAFGSLLDKAVGAIRRGLAADRPADQLRAAALVFDNYRSYRSVTEAVEMVSDLADEVEALRGELAAAAAPPSSADEEVGS